MTNLKMKRDDVLKGFLLATGMTRANIRSLIAAMPEETSKAALIDFEKAVEFSSDDYLINFLGKQLGIDSNKIDNFFKTKNWKELTRKV